MDDLERPLFPISVVADILGVHPQTLRLYERAGLVVPKRTKGRVRLYSVSDVDRLKTILHLTQELGINLAGVGLLLEFQQRVQQMDDALCRILEHLRDGHRLSEKPGTDSREDPGPPMGSAEAKRARRVIKIPIEDGT